MAEQRPPHDAQGPEEDDAIIELTDVVDSPETASEEIIELTEVVAHDAGEDDEVIELTDVVESAPAPEAEVDQPPAEEPVIELTDVVPAEDNALEILLEESETEAPEEAPQAAGVEESTSGDLAFAEMELDLEDRKEDELFDSLGMNLEAGLLEPGADSDELDFNLSTQELSDAIDLLDAKLAEDSPRQPAVEKNAGDQPVSLESDQLEAALENVIKKMFKEKIDHLLNDAIEKTVSTEMERLKAQLLGDDSEKP